MVTMVSSTNYVISRRGESGLAKDYIVGGWGSARVNIIYFYKNYI